MKLKIGLCTNTFLTPQMNSKVYIPKPRWSEQENMLFLVLMKQHDKRFEEYTEFLKKNVSQIKSHYYNVQKQTNRSIKSPKRNESVSDINKRDKKQQNKNSTIPLTKNTTNEQSWFDDSFLYVFDEV